MSAPNQASSSDDGTPRLNLLATVTEVDEQKEESKQNREKEGAKDENDDFYKQFEASIAA